MSYLLRPPRIQVFAHTRRGLRQPTGRMNTQFFFQLPLMDVCAYYILLLEFMSNFALLLLASLASTELPFVGCGRRTGQWQDRPDPHLFPAVLKNSR